MNAMPKRWTGIPVSAWLELSQDDVYCTLFNVWLRLDKLYHQGRWNVTVYAHGHTLSGPDKSLSALFRVDTRWLVRVRPITYYTQALELDCIVQIFRFERHILLSTCIFPGSSRTSGSLLPVSRPVLQISLRNWELPHVNCKAAQAKQQRPHPDSRSGPRCHPHLIKWRGCEAGERGCEKRPH